MKNMKSENKRLHRFKKFLITDEKGALMAWSEQGQLCYVTNESWIDAPFPARAYSYQMAVKHIETTQNNRLRWKMEPGIYKIVPFAV
jgi:hypothetical protein